ncbi:MAG: S49 family peptidase [Treponema sp.]|jgi:ClpP class serine protease|nr:S49 family peptidase [Treponema sp.]
MKEVLYAAERGFLERYLKEKAACTAADYKAISDIWGKQINKPGSHEAVNKIYSLDGDTAHIAVTGPLSPEGPDIFDLFFDYGGTAHSTVLGALKRAKNDPAVQKVILDIDSPGGTLAGTDEVWAAVKALGKPSETRAGAYLASAAYWIALATDKILASSPASEIGSIGVIVATYDWSRFEENLGVKEVIITSSNAPDKHSDITSEHGKNTIKAQLDALERIFYFRVQEGRGVTVEHIAEHFGRGGLLVAADPDLEKDDAVSVGMIDGLVSGDYITGKPYPGPPLTEEQKKQVAASLEEALKPGARFYDSDGKELPPEECERIRLSLQNMTTPSLEGKNNPAPAGKTQEGQNMNLSELLTANPAAAAEIDRLKAEAKAEGRKEAQAEYSARVDKVLPIIQSAAYPASIKTIACNALAGKEEMSALTATVAVFDTKTESDKSGAAQEETKELGGSLAEAPDATPAAEKELDAAIQAEIDKRKVR